MHPKTPHAVRFVTAIWIGCALVGFAGLANYSSAPGITAAPPLTYPSIPELARVPSRPALLMFVHPQCPCSSASINELARVAARSRDRMDLSVLFVIPPESPSDWHHSALWTKANSIPGLHVIADHGGDISALFRMTTSGHCLVYDGQDKLVFSGGITAGRGHEGDSPGLVSVLGIASRTSTDGFRQCSTFGCPLSSPLAQNRQ